MRASVTTGFLILMIGGSPLAPAFAQMTPAGQPAMTGSEPLSNAASNTNPGNSVSEIAPQLPVPDEGPDATTRQYLLAAQRALYGGRTGEAQEALERAETRMLDRSVAYGDNRQPIHGTLEDQITRARRALPADVPTAERLLADALALDHHKRRF